jgi:hypothetical protein
VAACELSSLRTQYAQGVSLLKVIRDANDPFPATAPNLPRLRQNNLSRHP